MNAQNHKVVLISGANRGIAYAIAQHLAAQGYKLSLGIRNIEQFQQDTLLQQHPEEQIQCFYFDAKQADSAKHWVKQSVSCFKRIDALINCAGLLKIYHIEDEDESALDEMWEVNVKGTLRASRYALPYLRQSGEGRIINLVSMSGKRVKGLSSGYAISKFAQQAVSHSLRNIGWDDGIRVCSICPSWVNTDMAHEHCHMPGNQITQAEDIALLTASILRLPNNAVVNELAINCQLEV